MMVGPGTKYWTYGTLSEKTYMNNLTKIKKKTAKLKSPGKFVDKMFMVNSLCFVFHKFKKSLSFLCTI